MGAIDDRLDEKTLLELATPKTFIDGAAAAEHGSVEIVEHDEVRLRARVDDTEVYETAFWLSGDDLAWSCTCGAAEERPCEHLLASVFATWPGEAPVFGD